jgi:cytochrome c oxidase assembly protein subunit 15
MPQASPTHRFAIFTTALTFLLVVAGGLVTSRDAGLAVPDWPLSFGSINPPRWYAIENVRTEHGHRVIAFCAAVATAVLGLKIRRSETRRSVRWLGTFAVFAVLLQAALGGLRVLNLSLDLAMIHGWFGQMFFAVLVSIVTLTSAAWPGEPASPNPARPASTETTRKAIVLVTVVVSQLVVGIWIRHQGIAARPLAGNFVFFAHAALAFCIVAAAVVLRGSIERDTPGNRERLEPRCTMLLGLLIVQMMLGLATFGATETMVYERQATFLESWIPTFHVAAGAAILAGAASLALHVFADRIVFFDSNLWATRPAANSLEEGA